MKKSNQIGKVDLNITKPTETEIKQTKKLVKDKYDIAIPKSDVIKLINLVKELDWWVKADKPGSSRHISEKMALEFKELVKQVKGMDISTSVASDSARGLLVLVPLKEKQRISDEIRAILVTHREILLNPVVTEKTTELLRLHYNIELNDDQLEQLIQLLSKKVWFEEGLNESLEKCLDDLIVYADKCKRGKRLNGLNLHDKIRQALDEAVEKLKSRDK
jgi:hypothetical protein